MNDFACHLKAYDLGADTFGGNHPSARAHAILMDRWTNLLVVVNFINGVHDLGTLQFRY